MNTDPAGSAPATTATFHDYFVPMLANTPEQQRQALRIRYEVYCREFGFERPEDHPDALETDEYDAQSLHCLLIHQPSGRAAGCVRLVLPSAETPDAPLPFEKHCGESLDKKCVSRLLADRSRIGEISRLAVIKDFRRRGGERLSPEGDSMSQDGFSFVERRHFPFIAVGLYLCAASTGMLSGLRGVFAMMEPRLARHLSRYGIRFEQVGRIMDYHGPRAPFYITREGLIEGLKPEIGALLDTISSDLEPSIRHTMAPR